MMPPNKDNKEKGRALLWGRAVALPSSLSLSESLDSDLFLLTPLVFSPTGRLSMNLFQATVVPTSSGRSLIFTKFSSVTTEGIFLSAAGRSNILLTRAVSSVVRDVFTR